MSSTHGRLFGRANGNYGEGREPAPEPPHVPVKYNSFQGGFNVSDAEEDVAEQSSPDALDMEVNRRDALVKAPGTALYEVFDALKTPTQVALFVGLSLEQELVVFDAPFIGIKRSLGVPIVWVSTSTPASEIVPFFWTSFADKFIFSNGNNQVQSHELGTDLVQDEPLVPNGATFAVAAARLFVGGAVIDSIRQPMTVAWSGIEGYTAFDYVNDLGSGFESLINDQSGGDAIVAIRSMGLDMAAIVCRNSVWVGRRTGDLDRPLDFQPRVTGSGCIAETTCKTVYGGVMYLGSEGIEFFDGNKTTHVSQAIDDDLLPVDFSNIDRYAATYDPTTQRYFLFTPVCTYVFDITRGRWYKRSLKARGGVPFAEALPATTWSEVIGAWGDNYESWLTSGGDNATLPQMTFLGQDSDFLFALHREEYGSYLNFGFAFKPRWQSVLGSSPVASDVITTEAIHIRYKEGGTIDFYLPDLNAFLTKVTQTALTLPISSSPRLLRRRGLYTGLEVGWKIEFLTGIPEISQIELGVIPRGPRIAPGAAFIPREYEPDF